MINSDYLLESATKLRTNGNTASAVQICQSILNKQPDNIDALNLLGRIAIDTNDPIRAVDYYRSILRIQPTHFEAQFYLGKLYDHLDQPLEALDCYREALQQDPKNPILYFAIGLVLQKMNNSDAALQCYQMAIRHKPDYWEALNNLSCLARSARQWELSLEYARQAVAIQPRNCSVLNSLGSAYKELGYHEKAVECLQQAIAIDPADVTTLINLGDVYLADRDIDNALLYTNKALQIQPDAVTAHWHRALICLLSGNYRDGWNEYEWRWQTSEFQSVKRHYSQPFWNGTTHPDKTLFVWAEQGLGDTLQFIRYLEAVKGKVGRIVVEVPESLHPLIKNSIDADAIVTPADKVSDFDLHIPLMSLPRVLYPSVSEIPGRCPYLFPSPDYSSDIERSFEHQDSPVKVGIVWAGNPHHANDHNRSCPLEYFTALTDIPNVSFYSLQKGERRFELQRSPGGHRIKDISEDLHNFNDTAAAIQKIDLIITVDTAAAHLAGALDKPIWLLLPFTSDWRWQLHRNDSPWYPSMHLFRQEKWGNWAGIFQRLRRSLHQFISSR